MADPRNELADIIVPSVPDVAAGGSGLPLWALAAGLVGVACVGLAIWLWQRRRPVRALNAITRAVALRQDPPSELAARLDAWARARFRLLRLDASSCPPGLDAATWFAWVNTLMKLRFAPSQADGCGALATLCETARQWGRHA
jgi:hypothetical protein